MLRALVFVIASAFFFVLSFGAIVALRASPPAAVIILCAGAALAAATVAFYPSSGWIVSGLGAGAAFVIYLLTVFFSLLARADFTIWPLLEAVLVMGSALLAARAVSRWRRPPAPQAG
jgi:hypothetical protein